MITRGQRGVEFPKGNISARRSLSVPFLCHCLNAPTHLTVAFRNLKPDEAQSEEEDVGEITYEGEQDAEPADDSATNSNGGFRVANQ